MNISYLCIFLAFILNYLTKFPVAKAMAKSQGGYNNHYPRDQQDQLTGFGKRALGAHLNGFEIFPAFAVSVIIANLAYVDANRIALMSIAFLISRLVYIYLYYIDKPLLRSTVWTLGFVFVTLNFVMAIF